MANKEADAVYTLACKVLGWTEDQVAGVPLAMIMEMVRNNPDPDAKRLFKAIAWGYHPSNPHPIWLDDPVPPGKPVPKRRRQE